MKTRNAETPKSGSAKKTPVKKSVTKTPPKPSEAAVDSTTPKSVGTKVSSDTGEKQPETPNTASKPEIKEDSSASVNAAKTTPVVKPTTAAKPMVKKIVKQVKTPVAKAASPQTPKSIEAVKGKPGGSLGKEHSLPAKVNVPPKKGETAIAKTAEPVKKNETMISNAEESLNKNVEIVSKVGEYPNVEEKVVEKEVGKDKPSEEAKTAENSTEPPVTTMEEGSSANLESNEHQAGEDECIGDDEMEDYGEQEGFEEPGDEEIVEDDVSEPDDEAGKLEEMQMEMSELAKERKIKKEQEIFVGGLDRDAVEEDVKKAFEGIGEVIEVRLHRNPLTNKNKGYAFVKFPSKELASRALAELKNPLIRGKRCGTAPSEDNDTIFLGNICNTWTKEAIKQKLKEYGIEGVENITLVADARHEGLSRGFAFIEFSCHADAMLAYKRLQKPDAIFGHAERTAKVAFAEPLREPDPEVMAQVKSVFVDGLPAHWDEDRVKEHFKGFGEIDRIVLARNMSTAKRKDFGFVDFTTHGAAIACIDGVNNTGLGDGKSKTKVKARLSNPLPKTQAVKGGMRGGFRIGRPGSGGFSRFGKGFGRGGHSFNSGNIQRGRGFYPRGRGQMGRFDFVEDDRHGRRYPEFTGRRPFGGRVGGRRGSTSSRPVGTFERGREKHFQSKREPFSPEGDYSRSFGGRQFDDDHYPYESGHGMKRPFSAMMDQDPGYPEPSRLRPRFDYPDPAISSRGTRYRDTYGEGSGLYSHDYYSSDYGGGSYSSLYGSDRSYGGGYYY